MQGQFPNAGAGPSGTVFAGGRQCQVRISHRHFAGGRGGVIFGSRLRRGLRLPRTGI